MKPILVAIKGKGTLNALRRATEIVTRYGVTSSNLSQSLEQFVQTLGQFGCRATFPITAVALQRHNSIIRQLQEQGTEFAIHGYRHVDHSGLSLDKQLNSLALSKQIISRYKINAQGFRCPYLRWNPATLTALRRQGFSYDSSQALAWDVLDGYETPTYRKAMDFYQALPVGDFPSLPSLKDGLVCIPYSLPDDEALVERLRFDTPEQMSATWKAILQRAYDIGELFTLGLHPERFYLCRDALIAVLEKARQFEPKVWIARLDEIDHWWRARSTAAVALENQPGAIRISVSGPEGLTVLARSVEVDAPTGIWANGYRQVKATTFSVGGDQRPFIGIYPGASPTLINFLQQQGYIIEISEQKQLYPHYFDWTEFHPKDQRPLLLQIEASGRPLVRLGRWPDGTHSALSITGDIDALTIWDYGLRFLGG
ncbi:MAG: polysaccharide deacetylase family protein [Anaerolineales bacterium]|nr:polysaccharide deacetylase family protein [Anaerolineales bacterium]